jgi:hypothetical protein
MSGGLHVKRVVVGVAVSAVLLMTWIGAADALGATYEVHVCRLPSGAPAPAHGWTTTSTSGPGAVAEIDCPGGAMTLTPAAGEHIQGHLLGFSFTAPPGTTIVSYNRHAEGAVNTVWGGPPPWHWEYGEFGTSAGSGEFVAIAACDNCGGFTFNWDMPRLPVRLSQLFSALRCGPRSGSGPCQANGSHFVLRWITVRLDDLKHPEVLSASGSLLDSSAPHRGERFLSLRLRDVGGGLLRTRVEVDGQRFAEQAVDDNGGRCKAPFVAPVPCKLEANVELPIDTTRISDGRHQLAVRVFDATGVNSAVYGPIPIDVDNPGGAVAPAPRLSCPPRGAGRLTRQHGTRVTRFGGTASVSGRVAGRISLRGTRVALVDLSGRRATAKSARVRPGGRFRLRLRPQTSRLVRPILLGASGAPSVCGAPIRLSVRAGVKLAVAPNRLRNGESIRMQGRLQGLPTPRIGKTILVQARAKGAPTWTRVSMIRAGASGRFTFRYRFRRTFQHTTYEFRAVSPRQRGYPYARGWSRVRRAVVTP